MNIALWVPCMHAKFLRGGLIPKPHIASTRKQRDAPVNSTGLGGLAISVLMVEQREAAGLFFGQESEDHRDPRHYRQETVSMQFFKDPKVQR